MIFNLNFHLSKIATLSLMQTESIPNLGLLSDDHLTCNIPVSLHLVIPGTHLGDLTSAPPLAATAEVPEAPSGTSKAVDRLFGRDSGGWRREAVSLDSAELRSAVSMVSLGVWTWFHVGIIWHPWVDYLVKMVSSEDCGCTADWAFRCSFVYSLLARRC